MKKIIAVFFIIFGSLLISSLLISGCKKRFEQSSQERVKYLTDITLPEDLSEIYYYKGATFTGVATHYVVYEIKNEPEFITKNENASNKIDQQTQEFIIDTLEKEEVSNKYYPDFNQEYVYITSMEQSYFIYYPKEQVLKVFIFGH